MSVSGTRTQKVEFLLNDCYFSTSITSEKGQLVSARGDGSYAANPTKKRYGNSFLTGTFSACRDAGFYSFSLD